MVCLVFTGIYIHFPFFHGFMGIARGAHLFFGLVLLINMVFRVLSAFFVKSASNPGSREVKADVKSFFPSKDNRHQLGAWIKYYLFLQKEHPLGAKYGVPQKLTYSVIPLLILFIAYTGFALWAPSSGAPIFAAFTAAVGGIMNVRIIHFFMMVLFVLFIMLHAYLASIEGISPLKMMFAWKEHGGMVYGDEEHTIVGEDDLEEEASK
jgi:Ni/Fe-hydrogenase 1 B-type cytochrome subunit